MIAGRLPVAAATGWNIACGHSERPAIDHRIACIHGDVHHRQLEFRDIGLDRDACVYALILVILLLRPTGLIKVKAVQERV